MKIAFIRANTYNSEPRLHKLDYLIGNSFKKFFILWNRDKAQLEHNHNSVYFQSPLQFGDVHRLAFKTPLWLWFCLRSLKKISPDIVHSCDLEGVIPGYVYAKIYRKKLVFDIWDATSGKIIANKPLIKKIINMIDLFFIKRSDLVLVPDKERIDQIGAHNFASKIFVLPNSRTFNNNCSKKLTFQDKPFSVCYIGVLSRKIRGIEQIISVAKIFPQINFKIAGYGQDEKFFKEEISLLKLPNLIFFGKVTTKEADQIIKSSDVVISLLDPGYENYKYATSTKIFDAMARKKPVITTTGTASGNVISLSGWGIAIEYSEQSLVNALNQISNGHIFDLNANKIKKYNLNNYRQSLRNAYIAIAKK